MEEMMTAVMAVAATTKTTTTTNKNWSKGKYAKEGEKKKAHYNMKKGIKVYWVCVRSVEFFDTIYALEKYE